MWGVAVTVLPGVLRLARRPLEERVGNIEPPLCREVVEPLAVVVLGLAKAFSTHEIGLLAPKPA
eukprot:8059698-Pyramimonas_sp.AAC.1